MRRPPRLAVAVALLGAALRLSALVFEADGDPDYHASRPTGAFADAGWQWETDLGVCATAVGPRAFITANHLANAYLLDAGGGLFYDGLYYKILGATNAPDSDIRFLWVAGRVRSWAPVSTNRSEIGASVFLVGRGGPRGAPVTTTNDAGVVADHGWLWNPSDGRLRWGVNQVYSTTPDTNLSWPHNMIFRFYDTQDPNLAVISGGDSGGGAFIQDNDGLWKLAGTIFLVEGSFRRTPAGPTFNAAILDRRGLYEEDDTGAWILDPAAPASPWTVFATTRLSDFGDWIQGRLAAAAPGDPAIQLLTSESPAGPFAEAPAYAVDPAARRVSAPADPAQIQFYRLAGAEKILGFGITNRTVTLDY